MFYLKYKLNNSLLRLSFIGILVSLLLGCSRSTHSVKPSSEPPPPLPSTEIYFYPEKGQSKSLQQRDRYECYRWAVKKSGFDPNQAQLAPHQRFEVKASPRPGTGVIVGAATGAVIGSISAHPRRSAEGLVFGAVAGALVGAATDIARHDRATRIQRQYDENDANRYVRLEMQSRNYRRAMSACLEGRGYSVQ
ncbi:MAG: glycine zipper 2TM domain-containing protein [Methylococcaceae bacterium]